MKLNASALMGRGHIWRVKYSASAARVAGTVSFVASDSARPPACRRTTHVGVGPLSRSDKIAPVKDCAKGFGVSFVRFMRAPVLLVEQRAGLANPLWEPRLQTPIVWALRGHHPLSLASALDIQAGHIRQGSCRPPGRRVAPEAPPPSVCGP